MMSLLPLRTWLRLGAAALALAALSWLAWQIHTGNLAKTALVEATAALVKSEQENTRARERAARSLAAADAAVVLERARAEEARSLLDAIDAADPSLDGPVSPVLLDTLRRLP